MSCEGVEGLSCIDGYLYSSVNGMVFPANRICPRCQLPNKPTAEVSPAERKHRLIMYILAKVQEQDWHAVSDAAVDLRVLEAEHPEVKGVKGKLI